MTTKLLRNVCWVAFLCTLGVTRPAVLVAQTSCAYIYEEECDDYQMAGNWYAWVGCDPQYTCEWDHPQCCFQFCGDIALVKWEEFSCYENTNGDMDGYCPCW